jgi:hypothetical protein
MKGRKGKKILNDEDRMRLLIIPKKKTSIRDRIHIHSYPLRGFKFSDERKMCVFYEINSRILLQSPEFSSIVSEYTRIQQKS